VNFLVDAQLPRRLAHRLREAGHDALHTLDLTASNRTTDEEISTIADREGRTVVTKDSDFVNSFLLSGKPRKLLLVSVGNTSNANLEALIMPRLAEISSTLLAHDYVELTKTAIIVHE
jgi:predicted nuclease of predicted toxin-antitoxin system